MFCSQKGSVFTTWALAGTQRPKAAFMLSFVTSGCIQYFIKSLATATFWAPFGM